MSVNKMEREKKSLDFIRSCGVQHITGRLKDEQFPWQWRKGQENGLK